MTAALWFSLVSRCVENLFLRITKVRSLAGDTPSTKRANTFQEIDTNQLENHDVLSQIKATAVSI